MADTSIEWTDKVWNPVTGCRKISPGCTHCYADTIAGRFWAKQYPPNTDGSPRSFTDVRWHYDRLEQPLKWKKPARIFVNSMSDLFHEDVPDSFIDRMFAVMALARRHTFQILTKRPARMLSYFENLHSPEQYGLRWDTAREWLRDTLLTSTKDRESMGRREYVGVIMANQTWPLPNVWLGVSVENQKYADERIPLLLQTPAAVRWVSAEPLLGRVELDHEWVAEDSLLNGRIDWIVAGGESGTGARPMHPDWARSLRDQCTASGVPFLFKQWGEHKAETVSGVDVELSTLQKNQSVAWGDGKTNHTMYTKVGKHAAGRLLDGREWNEYPAVTA